MNFHGSSDYFPWTSMILAIFWYMFWNRAVLNFSAQVKRVLLAILSMGAYGVVSVWKRYGKLGAYLSVLH